MNGHDVASASPSARPGEPAEPPRVPDGDADWDALLDTQPWARVINSADRRYRYAVCDRPMA
ncbi:MAG: hypothetical protein ACR2GO_02380 [Candidatus Limnocylindria bacterium]